MSFAFFANANLINDMQGCQAINQFVIDKFERGDFPNSDGKADTVVNGLKMYNQYIQQEIITPGLLKFNGGDTAKADAMQKQVDQYKARLALSHEKTYPTNIVVQGIVYAINDCTKKAVPGEKGLKALKSSLSILIGLANIR